MNRFEYNLYSLVRHPFLNLITGGAYANYQFLRHDRNMNGYIDYYELNPLTSPYGPIYPGNYYPPGLYPY
ncbi:unnamed protein product [Brachionus calyciflorus]|uniref:EF-hand domain-containing protein n=1 Tax=Brachionus calyciflorus TaxID=104777 RepID=A0A814C8T8_9BILA|nr:unnamed protein product [Brachionus calyciflorus]